MASKLNFRLIDVNSEEAYEIICYPKVENEELEVRLKELKMLGVEKLIVKGNPRDLVRVKVLGVGHAGVVVKAIWRGIVVALKVRRVDSKRSTLELEAKLQKLASKANVAPKLYAYTKNFIVMEYIDGVKLSHWLEKVEKHTNVELIVRDVIYRCRALDVIGLDHGELAHAKSHVIITSNRTYIIDYESASTNRRPKNVTSICSYLFLRPSIECERLRRIFNIEPNKLRELLRRYKSNISENNFNDLVNYIFRK